jgi:hypothetical protein
VKRYVLSNGFIVDKAMLKEYGDRNEETEEGELSKETDNDQYFAELLKLTGFAGS